MSTLEDLPADQRAVLTLVLVRGRSYGEIGSALSIDRAAVRARASSAMATLGGPTELDVAELGLLTDYLLGQLPDGVAMEMQARLEHDGPAREWASSVAAALEPIATEPLPPIATRRPSSRRGGAILLAAVGLVLAAGITFAAISALGGSSGPSGTTAGGATTTAGADSRTQPATATHPFATPFSSPPPAGPTTDPVKVLARLALLPPDAPAGRREAGIAEVVRTNGQTGIVIVAQGLAANTRRNAYAVWLSAPAGATAFLGFVSRLVTANGKLTADGPLPADAARYSRVLLTLETASKPKVPGRIILEGGLALRR
jgi:hypothetical protein